MPSVSSSRENIRRTLMKSVSGAARPSQELINESVELVRVHGDGSIELVMKYSDIGLVRRYTRARKPTPRMLNELVEKIEGFNAEKIDGVWEQRLRIHYNCVGTIEIPTVLPLPIPEVSVNTRKGVVVNYAPCELAV